MVGSPTRRHAIPPDDATDRSLLCFGALACARRGFVYARSIRSRKQLRPSHSQTSSESTTAQAPLRHHSDITLTDRTAVLAVLGDLTQETRPPALRESDQNTAGPPHRAERLVVTMKFELERSTHGRATVTYKICVPDSPRFRSQ